MAIQSNFFILDVSGGRDDLKKRIEAGQKVRVTIEADVDSIWGADDGVSREFGCIVRSVKEVA